MPHQGKTLHQPKSLEATPLFNLYRNAVVGILVYSVCSRESFNNLENWITNLKKYALPWSKLILLGNKCDDELKREVTFEEGKKYVINIIYYFLKKLVRKMDLILQIF